MAKLKIAITVKFSLLAVFLIATSANAQTRDPFFQVYPEAGKVHMLEAPDAGGNIGVFSGEDGIY